MPTLVKGLIGAASKIQAGEEHTCAEMVDGSVQCWGSNVSGQIGDNTTTDRPIPTKVSLPTTVKKLSSGGGAHNCAALNDGSVWCWGLNDKEQLGVSGAAMSSSPVQVVGVAGVKKVWVGRQHSCALLGDATVQCWGANDFGQLGDATTNQRATPAPVMGLSDVVGVGGGYRHSCAVLGTTATVKCWGANDHGQLGLGADAAAFVTQPALVPGVTVFKETAGTKGESTCAIASDENMYCWGWNDDGQLGDGTTVDRATPTLVMFK
jgi:alpha-tubulin suppressor-like RCC1 family protein